MSSYQLNIQYNVYVTIVNITSSVVDGSCECKALAMGRCYSHVAALLLTFDDYIVEFGREPIASTI